MQLQKTLAIRTNNFTDPQMAGKFKMLWSEAMVITPPNTTIYGVYSDYQSDYMGDYTMGIYDESQIARLHISSTANYEIYSVNSSDEEGILAMWRRIWEQEDLGKIKRAYTYDYERYDANGEITIHVAVL